MKLYHAHRKALRLFLCLCTAILIVSPLLPLPSVSAAEATDVTSVSNVVTSGFYNPPVVLDGSYRDYTNAYNGATVTASNENGIAYVYFIFESPATEFTVEDTEKGEKRTFGGCGMIHELLDLEKAFGYAPKAIRIDLDFQIAVSEIYLFSSGELPDWVQVWEAPLTESDMLLLVSHSDDDQLFFAGLLPIYAGEQGLKVQVAYFTNHNDVANRRHELLDGLWHTGVRNYPIIAEFPDLYSESYDGALWAYANAGYEKQDFTDFVYDLIQSTRPLVVVTHDIEGEYGHGTHRLCAAATIDALNKASAPDKHGDIDGKWNIAKLYIHLYEENKLTLDIDRPLSAFGGKSAFKVSQEAFEYHISQHWTWFYGWLYGNGTDITLSTQITTHSPREYGLYYSAVGMDTGHSDLFENLETIAEREERLEEERRAEESREAEESRKADESSRAESESIAESISISEAESIAAASSENNSTSTTAEKVPTGDKTSHGKLPAVAVLVAAMVCVIILLAIQFKRR